MNPPAGFERPESEADWRRFLGRKASIRYRLPPSADMPSSEAIGVVAGVESDPSPSVSILDKRGESKVIAIDDIEAAKVWPP